MIADFNVCMGQPEVYDFLKENKHKWFTAKDIMEKTEFSSGSVSVALRGLRKSDQVDYKIIKVDSGTGAKRGNYAYRFKREIQTSLLIYLLENEQ